MLLSSKSVSQRDILALPIRLRGLRRGDPCQEAEREYTSLIEVTAPEVEALVKSAQYAMRNKRTKELEERAARIKQEAPQKTRSALELAAEKGASVWLTVLPLQELGFTLNKRQFREVFKLRYDWPIDDLPFIVGAFTICSCLFKRLQEHK